MHVHRGGGVNGDKINKTKKTAMKKKWKKHEVSRGMFKVDKVKAIEGPCSIPVAADILLARQ